MPIAAHRMKPLPAGYVEAMKSWEGEKSEAEIKALVDELTTKLLAKHPEHKSAGNAQYESVRDGLGVVHYTLYVGAVPVGNAAETPSDG